MRHIKNTVVRRRELGFSILETLIALFIVLMSLLITVQLLHSSLQRSTTIRDRENGALYIQEKLEEIRVQATQPDIYEAGLTAFDNVVHTDPSFPDFQLRTTLNSFRPASPSYLLEEPYAALNGSDSRRILEDSCTRLTLDCWWGESSQERLRVTTLLAAPPRPFHSTTPLVISGGPSGSLARDEEATFTVEAFDENNTEIRGLTFQWFVLGSGGNGVVRQSRDGRTGIVGNWVINVDGVTRAYAPGDCELVVQAQYNGQTRSVSTEVNLL